MPRASRGAQPQKAGKSLFPGKNSRSPSGPSQPLHLRLTRGTQKMLSSVCSPKGWATLHAFRREPSVDPIGHRICDPLAGQVLKQSIISCEHYCSSDLRTCSPPRHTYIDLPFCSSLRQREATSCEANDITYSQPHGRVLYSYDQAGSCQAHFMIYPEQQSGRYYSPDPTGE